MQKLKKKISSQQQNSKMPPKKDNAEKKAKDPTLNVLTKDSDVIRALQYIKFRQIHRKVYISGQYNHFYNRLFIHFHGVVQPGTSKHFSWEVYHTE